ncbi:hypothetical protein RMP42_05811 (plasmid) [Roseomonas mucosa]|nr:hypothetical protein RMP42_05811 [Roseomonas mucosa]
MSYFAALIRCVEQHQCPCGWSCSAGQEGRGGARHPATKAPHHSEAPYTPVRRHAQETRWQG